MLPRTIFVDKQRSKDIVISLAKEKKLFRELAALRNGKK